MKTEQISVNSDAVTLRIDGTYTAQELRDLLEKISSARAQIADVPASGEKAEVRLMHLPAWYCGFNPQVGAHVMSYRDPGLGWIGFSFTTPDASAIAQLLHQQVIAVHSIGVASPASPDTGGVGDSDGPVTRH